MRYSASHALILLPLTRFILLWSSALPQHSHALLTQPFLTRPIFLKSLAGFFTGALYGIEGSIAAVDDNKKKVNANNRDDTNLSKYDVVSDSEYNNSNEKQRQTPSSSFDHSAWDRIMKTYVSPGVVDGITTNVVDYRALANDPSFDSYRESLSTADLSSLHPNELLALYINAYNALCIGHVIRYYKSKNELPVSVKNAVVTDDSTTTTKEVWDLEAGVVGGATVTLNDIENNILRSRWTEPRIHASIVCASASCPNLRREAFVASKLNQQMDDQVRQWMADTTKGLAVDKTSGAGTFTRIFLWFKDDFSGFGGPVAWARKYIPEDLLATLNPDLPPNYFVYNWNLNTKPIKTTG